MASFILPPSFGPNPSPFDSTAYIQIVDGPPVSTHQHGLPAFCSPNGTHCYQDHFLMAIVSRPYTPANRRAHLHYETVLHLPDYPPRPIVKNGVSWLIWTDPQTNLETLRINRSYLSSLQP